MYYVVVVLVLVLVDLSVVDASASIASLCGEKPRNSPRTPSSVRDG